MRTNYDQSAQDFHVQLMQGGFPRAVPFTRIVMNKDVNAFGTDPLGYSLSPRCAALLVVKRGPEHITSLAQYHATAWNVTREQVWASAMHNMAQQQVKLDSQPSKKGDVPVVLATASDWPASGNVMRLGDLLPQPTPFGAVALVSNHSSFLFVPLVSRRSVPVIADLIDVFRMVTEDKGAPLVDQMLWWCNGRVTPMDFTMAPGEVPNNIHSPEFHQMLSHLPA